jgi:hypothetical protein
MAMSIARAIFAQLYPGGRVYEAPAPKGNVRACDFCAAESRSTGGIYKALHFNEVTPSINFGVLGPVAALIDENGWGACDECQAAIDAGQTKRLRRRIVQAWIVMAQAEGRYRSGATVEEAKRRAQDVVTIFFNNRVTDPAQRGRMQVMAAPAGNLVCPTCGEACGVPVLTTKPDFSPTGSCYTFDGESGDWRNGMRFHLKGPLDAMLKAMGATAMRIDYSKQDQPEGFLEHGDRRVSIGPVEDMRFVDPTT